MKAGGLAAAVATLVGALAVGGCGHVTALDAAQFGPSRYVVECHDDDQCARRMSRVCPGGYEAFRPGVVGIAAIVTADAPAEALVREPARALGLDVETPRRRYIRCLDEGGGR